MAGLKNVPRMEMACETVAAGLTESAEFSCNPRAGTQGLAKLADVISARLGVTLEEVVASGKARRGRPRKSNGGELAADASA